jgi:hypothetical protein
MIQSKTINLLSCYHMSYYKFNNNKNQIKSKLKELKSDNKITDKFLDQISLLTLEDIITIKLELSLKNSGGLLYGLPIWNNLSDIIRYSLLKSSLSMCKNKTEAANFLGITLGHLLELIEKYNLTKTDD